MVDYCQIEVEVKWSRSVVSDSESPRTAAHQAPPSLGFSREDYWNGLQSILSSLNAVFHCIPSHTEIITMDLGTKEASEIWISVC